MLPIERLEQLSRRYVELDELLCRPDVLSDRDKLSKLNKERTDIQPLVDNFTRYRKVLAELQDAQDALGDPELRALAEDDLARLGNEKEDLEGKIQVLLIPPDPNDGKNTILEIRAGEGGEEAALFAADLFRMYARYAETQRWTIEIVSSSDAAMG